MFQSHACSGVIMSCGSILETARSGRTVAGSAARPNWAISVRRVKTVPAVAPAAAARNFRLDAPVAHFRVSLMLHPSFRSST
jgi:hypothetical protein